MATRTAEAADFSPARRQAQILSALGFALGTWALFYPWPYDLCVVVLAVAPVAALVLIAEFPGRWTLNEPRLRPRPNLDALFAVPALVLGARAFLDIHMLDWRPTLAAAAGLGAILGLTAARAVRRERRGVGIALLLILVGVDWGWGVVSETNVRLDRAPARQFSTQVLGRWISHGRQTRYNLRLAPWGPRATAQSVDVARPVYETATPGMNVCVALHRGSLGFRWFDIAACGALSN